MMSEIFKDWSTVVVSKEDEKATLRELLGLAEHVAHVRTTGQVGEFLIHPDVAARYTDPPKPKPRQARAKKEAKEAPQ